MNTLPTVHRPEFETQEEWRSGITQGPWWKEVHWSQCFFAGFLGFALGIAAWGLV